MNFLNSTQKKFSYTKLLGSLKSNLDKLARSGLLIIVGAWIRVIIAGGFIIALVGISGLVFLNSGQAQDLFLGICNDSFMFKGVYNYFTHPLTRFTGITVLFSLTIWYSLRVLFNSIDLSGNSNTFKNYAFINQEFDWENKWNNNIIHAKKYIPRILAICPFAVNTLSFFKLGCIGIGLVQLASLILLFILFIFRRKVSNSLENRSKLLGRKIIHKPKKISEKGGSIKEFPRIFYFVFVIEVILLIAPLILRNKPLIHISQFLTTPIIVMLSFSGWAIVFVFITYVNNKSFFSLSFLLAILILLFGLTNSNHDIRIIEAKAGNKQGEYLDEYFHYWINERLPSITADSNTVKTLPVVVIAAEGGGIRALQWTSLVLDKLKNIDPNFNQSIFSMTGTSGGSVGIVFDLIHTEFLAKNNLSRDGNEQGLYKEAISGDFLSPLIFGFLYPDLAQKLIPIPFKKFDRARMLEDGLMFEYEKNLDINSEFEESFWEKGFLEFSTDQEGYIPNVLLNTSKLETGEKVILSNKKLPRDYFGPHVDLFQQINFDIPLKTTAILSSRFPFVTPPGCIPAGKGNLSKNAWGNIVDGGYYENTSLQTALSVMFLIKNELNALTNYFPSQIKVEPVLIFIQNSNIGSSYKPITNHLSLELRTPFTLYKSWSREAENTVKLVEDLSLSNNVGFKFYHFKLSRGVHRKPNSANNYKSIGVRTEKNHPKSMEINIPLGWYLSNTATKEIRYQADLLTKYDLLLDKNLGDNTVESQMKKELEYDFLLKKNAIQYNDIKSLFQKD